MRYDKREGEVEGKEAYFYFTKKDFLKEVILAHENLIIFYTDKKVCSQKNKE